MTTLEKINKLYNDDKTMPLPNRKCCKCGNLSGPCCPSVGIKYDEEDIPKLLIVSLDNAGGEERSVSETCVSQKKKNLHWRETCTIADILLSPFTKQGRNYFSHTNSAKCKEQTKNTDMSSNNLFVNCKDFVIKDVECFSADIIITQGKNATLWLNELKLMKEGTLEGTRKTGVYTGIKIQLRYGLYIINEKKTIIIKMSHPSTQFRKSEWSDGIVRGGRWTAQKQLINDNISKIEEEIRNINI
jgi:hypothetical protein